MEYIMMNATRKIKPQKKSEPVLLTILKKAEDDYKQSEEMFDLLGWSGLPAELKFAIGDDVKAYYDEVHGRYSTNCSYVQRRRESVDFWVKSYQDDICTLETAVEALKVSKL
jgi:hypothetical protein